MRGAALALTGLVVAFVAMFLVVNLALPRALEPDARPGPMAEIPEDRLATVNTTRLGSDDPVETAVAVSQTIYPATEEENVPGAVVLVNRDRLAEILVAASRVQHFPTNAPLLYAADEGLPEATRQELVRLRPEGAFGDRNVQVYLVGTIPDQVRREVEDLGYRTRALRGRDPVHLARVVDEWTTAQHGDAADLIAVVDVDQPETGIPSAFWNAHRGDGLIFVTDDGIPRDSLEMIKRRGQPFFYVFGDESVVPAGVAAQLASYGHVTRVPGGDLPELSSAFAGFKDEGEDFGGWVIQGAREFGWGIDDAGRNVIAVNLAGPGGWQNAVVATTLSHMGKHAPVVMVERDRVPEPVVRFLASIRPYPTAPRQQLLNHAWVIGGLRTISWETQGAIDLMLEGHRRQPGGDK